ncbi:MAG: hypothetical protein ACRD19_08195, partial [Terriglobia bacterium]
MAHKPLLKVLTASAWVRDLSLRHRQRLWESLWLSGLEIVLVMSLLGAKAEPVRPAGTKLRVVAALRKGQA